MGRRRRTGSLTVALNGRVVGSLNRAPDGATSFKYASEWLDWEHRIAVSLSIPLDDRTMKGPEVLAYFENLLPDNEAVKSQIATRVGANGTDAFSLLEALGVDCVGAMQFLPEGSPVEAPGVPEGRPLTKKDLAERIRSLSATPLGVAGGGDSFRISVAGAQDKTALLFHDGRWMLPVGTTPTTHILKPQIGKLLYKNGEIDMSDSVQNEHFCLTLCRHLGFRVAKSGILKLPGGLLALSVERFDRSLDDKGRLHRLPQEDFCQALGVPPSRKYEKNHLPGLEGGPGILDCLELLKASDEFERDRKDLMKIQIVFWLLGATDGHAKNYSLFLKPGGGFEMTPFYDILSAQWQYDQSQIRKKDFQLAMAIGDKRRYRIEEIAPRHFEQTAKKAGVVVPILHEIMREIVESLPKSLVATRAEMDDTVPPEMVDAVSAAALRRADQIARYLKG